MPDKTLEVSKNISNYLDMVEVNLLFALKCRSGLKPNVIILPRRLFQPVQYGTKPEGRLAAITSVVGQRPPTSSPVTSTSVSTTNLSAQARGKSPVTTATTTTATSHGKTISGARLG